MANEALIEQLLDWIGPEPRNYAETLEAWRTSCPRLAVWEDAVTAGFIERVPGASLKDAQVRVTPQGNAYRRVSQVRRSRACAASAARPLEMQPPSFRGWPKARARNP